MTNVTREVWKILDESPCIKMNMDMGLINIRALARYIIKEKNINGSIDEVMNALRRYKINTFGMIFDNALKNISRSTTMSVKSSIASISIIKDIKVQELLPQLFTIVCYDQGDTLRIIQGNGSIKILLDEKNIEKAISLFTDKKIINIQTNLAEINVHMHPDAKNTPGVFAVTANELAINGINVIESMSSITEVLWFVKDKDLSKAYNVLNQLWHLKMKPAKKIEQTN